MSLPLLLSVPHAGLAVPPEVAELNLLEGAEIAADGDVGASEIYTLDEQVQVLVRAGVARAFVDMNRAEDDLRMDGVVKTHTCWGVPIYDEPLSEALTAELLGAYWRPYHRRLREAAGPELVLGVDCHTMAATGPPVGPDAGRPRPAACLSNADGTCPQDWIESMAALLAEALGDEVLINEPFRGGYICRSHAAELPWVQLELSRAPRLTDAEKRSAVLACLTAWCGRHA
jgi:formiminoglutamase